MTNKEQAKAKTKAKAKATACGRSGSKDGYMSIRP
jgi:hypothetical protein